MPNGIWWYFHLIIMKSSFVRRGFMEIDFIIVSYGSNILSDNHKQADVIHTTKVILLSEFHPDWFTVVRSERRLSFCCFIGKYTHNHVWEGSISATLQVTDWTKSLLLRLRTKENDLYLPVQWSRAQTKQMTCKVLL